MIQRGVIMLLVGSKHITVTTFTMHGLFLMQVEIEKFVGALKPI